MPTKRKSTRRKKKGTRRNPLRRVPSYVLWTVLGFIIVAYIAFFYRTFVGPYSFRWKALYGHVTYPDGKVRGLDISHYQGDIDWNLFEDEKARELKMLVDNPSFAHVRRQAMLSGKGTAQRVLSYFKAGGLEYVLMPRKY